MKIKELRRGKIENLILYHSKYPKDSFRTLSKQLEGEVRGKQREIEALIKENNTLKEKIEILAALRATSLCNDDMYRKFSKNSTLKIHNINKLTEIASKL